MVEKNKLDEELLEMEEEDTQEGKYLTFAMGNEEYGIEIRNVTEIIGIQNVTELPDVPPYVKGVINLRGKVIPVVDVRLRFGLQERAYDERTCIVVVNLNKMSLGLIVDSVSEVQDIPATDIQPPPRVNQGEASVYIQGLGKVGNEVKILLDVHRLFFDEEMEQIAVSNN
ncbi:MAG: chemotaxis protein CheW [bacterium]|nr:chemotaxis protein CheW [bacterium]